MLGRLLNRGPLVAETTASELAREIHEGTSLQIVDVRELDEWLSHAGVSPIIRLASGASRTLVD